MFLSMMCIVDKLSYNLIWCAASVSNPVYTDTGIPVFGTPNTDTGKNLPVLTVFLTTKRSFFYHKMSFFCHELSLFCHKMSQNGDIFDHQNGPFSVTKCNFSVTCAHAIIKKLFAPIF
jgi:hypothetical protein